ncbi:unnamed protein product [Hymenolepis diminuta]|uniref:Uncharacterized protein n=1 Tax=Hymenolepis diminuta TaxID=6216 RepID=A0A564XVL7_HYMDI|nr:unnamed protein product [Hymenolepis diminuta]
MPPSSTEAKGQCTENQERLATFGRTLGDTQVCFLNPECSDVVIKHQLPLKGYRNVVAFQSEILELLSF